MRWQGELLLPKFQMGFQIGFFYYYVKFVWRRNLRFILFRTHRKIGFYDKAHFLLQIFVMFY